MSNTPHIIEVSDVISRQWYSRSSATTAHGTRRKTLEAAIGMDLWRTSIRDIDAGYNTTVQEGTVEECVEAYNNLK